MTISKRALARIISLAAGIILALLVAVCLNFNRAVKAERAVENTYMRAVEELSLNLDNIKNNLEKGIYTNSISMLSTLSEKLCSDAATAKSALSQLPVEELDLSSTYRFLSQVGNYSKSLAEKCSEGSGLSEEEAENLAKLYSYAETLSNSMWKIEERIENGAVTFGETRNDAASIYSGEPVSVTDGFNSFTSNDNNYPTLIYDGPFSDHIMEKKPAMLENEDEVTKSEALRRAKKLTGDNELKDAGEEKGKMPSYVFSGDKYTVAVTKAGGIYSYMLSDRKIGKQTITASEAIEKAESFLSKMGVNNAEDTYYELNGGVCIINFAAVQNGVTMYTDLIKVEVALDNGEILGFDMRGYITNHIIRDIPEPKLSEERAMSLISKKLGVTGAKLCVIPSDGENEIFCYEVKCSGKDGENLLVYINAETGREEQILILKIGRNGMLTV